MVTLKYSPEFVRSFSKWKKIDDFVSGDTERVIDYLKPHESEKAQTPESRTAWASRQNRLQNENDCEPILEVHLAHLDQEIDVSALGENSRMAEILADVDGSGTEMSEQFRELLGKYLKHGFVGVLVDSTNAPASSEAGPSIADDEASGARSYQVIFTAYEVRLLERFTTLPDRGKISRLLLKEGVEVSDTGEVHVFGFYQKQSGVEGYQKTTLYIDGEDKITDKEVTFRVGATATGGTSEIPFVAFGEGLKDSTMRTPAQYNELLLNLRSLADNVLYHHDFPKLVFKGVDSDQIKYIGEATAICLPNPDSDVTVITPGAPDATFDRIARVEQKLRRHGMKQMNQIVSDGSAQAQSADSKSMDLKALGKFYSRTIKMFERGLSKVLRFHGEFEGIALPAGSLVTIGKEFGLEDKLAIQAQRSSLSMLAGQVGPGGSEVKKQIVLQGIAEMEEVIPDEGESEEDARKRLMDAVRTSKEEPPIFNPLSRF